MEYVIEHGSDQLYWSLTDWTALAKATRFQGNNGPPIASTPAIADVLDCGHRFVLLAEAQAAAFARAVLARNSDEREYWVIQAKNFLEGYESRRWADRQKYLEYTLESRGKICADNVSSSAYAALFELCGLKLRLSCDSIGDQYEKQTRRVRLYAGDVSVHNLETDKVMVTINTYAVVFSTVVAIVRRLTEGVN